MGSFYRIPDALKSITYFEAICAHFFFFFFDIVVSPAVRNFSPDHKIWDPTSSEMYYDCHIELNTLLKSNWSVIIGLICDSTNMAIPGLGDRHDHLLSTSVSEDRISKLWQNYH